MEKWLKWQKGRLETGYEKMLLLACRFILPFDFYLLRYKPGAWIPPHTDKISDKRHYRLNFVIKKAKKGGIFICENPIFETKRIKFFRPDLSVHSLTRINEGTRYVLSIGVALKNKHIKQKP